MTRLSSTYLYHYEDGRRKDGPHAGLRGDCTYLRGDCTYLRGNCTGIRGNCTDLVGDFDACFLTEADRRKGVDIATLVKPTGAEG